MKPEQQRIKIAEACGWKVHPNDRFIVIPPNSPHSVQPLSTIPDYLNDLNAMHEAEINYIIPNGLWDNYADWLKKIMRDGSRFWGQATAAQRAKAFLRTLNLWEE
jgi:hypothetical protein